MLKPILFGVVLPLYFGGSHLSAQEKPDLKKEILQVEMNLIPAVRFEGDPVWTLESRMKYYKVPGVSIAVIKDYKIIWSKGYGWADVEAKIPVKPKTLFQAASISKPLSAYAALKEVQSGKIDPDRDVNHYLKTWKIPENEFTKDKKVSLKNLVSHTGGLTVHGFAGYSSGKNIPNLVQVLNGTAPANSPAVVTDKVPGTPFRYSGGGYTVLQQLLIDIEDKDFSQIMKEKVLSPLKMNNSSFSQPLNQAQVKHAATAYSRDGKVVPGKYHTYPELAAAGLWTTAEDLAKFVIDIENTLAGKSQKIISRDLVNEFTSPYIDTYMGLGIFLGGENYFNHSGWNEGFSSKFIGSKNGGYGLVVLTNTNQPLFIEEIIRSVAATYNWPFDEVPIQKVFPLTQQDVNSAVGRYRADKYGFYKIYLDNGKLFAINNFEPPMELIKVSDNSYALREWEFKVRFVEDAENKKKQILLFTDTDNILSQATLLEEHEKTPFEMILEGDIENGILAFQKAKSDDPNHHYLNEQYINNVGYTLLNRKELKKAIDIFKVNTVLYPNSENTHHSLGEAYIATGEKSKAKESYQKVLQINPKNENAARILEDLQ